VLGRPQAINSSGVVVGWAVREGQQGHAFMWDHGKLQDLGLLSGDVNSEAHAINAKGDVVGVSRPQGADEFNHAVLWRNGQLIALGTLPGDVGSEAWGVNNRGQVFGESRGLPSTSRPFVWDHGLMTELTELKQPGVGFSFTRDEIVAWRCPDTAEDVAAKTTRRIGVIVYIPCPTKFSEEEAVDIEDINGSGQAVGMVWRRVGPHLQVRGYLWSGGERIPLPPVSGQTDSTTEPHAINDGGEIVGNSPGGTGTTLWTVR
jgi:probable HAF family extracellular repeat protein